MISGPEAPDLRATDSDLMGELHLLMYWKVNDITSEVPVLW